MQIAPTVTRKLYDVTHSEIVKIIAEAGVSDAISLETAERILEVIMPAAYDIVRAECIECDKQLKLPI